MSTLSDLLSARLPAEWTKTRLVGALSGRLDRATVYKYLAGNHPRNPHESVLQAFADVLPDLTLVELRAAVNQPVGIDEPWIPPVEANRLTLAQRQALEAFIKATVASTEAAAAAELPQPVRVAATALPVSTASGDAASVPTASMPAASMPAASMPAASMPAAVGTTGTEQVPADLSADEQAEVQRYLDQLNASGRGDLAERVAASLVINSASETASRSSRN